MKKRFAYELLVGIILLVAVILLGAKGLAAGVLFAFQPFIGKKNVDERESQLFNIVGNYTAGVTLVACVVIYLSSNAVINGLSIEKNWLGLVVASFLIAHGVTGLVMF